MIDEFEQEERFSNLASLIGERTRAKMLWHLLDGRAYTALELAIVSDTSKQSCSNHLKKLTEEKVLAVERQGRHKYFRLYDKTVASALESIAVLTTQKTTTERPCKTQVEISGIKFARSCYDHLAGYLGVAITDGFLKQGLIQRKGQIYQCTDKGTHTFGGLGVDVIELERLKRKFAYPCLDWSERKHHIGGALGAAILDFMIEDHWLRRKKNSRELMLTSRGQKNLRDIFEIEIQK